MIYLITPGWWQAQIAQDQPGLDRRRWGGVIWRPVQPKMLSDKPDMSSSDLSFRLVALLRLPVLVLLFFAGYGPAATGAEVSGLYDASTPVRGAEAAERNIAIRAVFGKVLVKITGNRQITSRKALAAELDNASRYLQQYRYELLPTLTSEGEPERLLHASFDKTELDRLLQNLSLPIWSANRPSILVWMGEERQGLRQLVSPDADTDVRLALAQVAAERGLPLMLPLMDLEDQGQMQVADLWGDFESNIRAASRRYAPDQILTGRLVSVSADLWRGEWRLYHADSHNYWNNEAASRQSLIADALQRMADNLADRFAPMVDERSLSTVRLRVVGIDSLSDYAAVLELLSAQNSLERVVLVSVEPNAVVYDLHGQGGVTSLAHGLGIGGLLEVDQGAVFQPDASAAPVDLYYRLR